jgi:excisionase family DNA binding protein
MGAAEKTREVLPPRLSSREADMARAAQGCIMAALDHARAATITVTTADGKHPTVDVPPAALKLIGQVLGAMSEGRPITLLPAQQEFTTVEAANFLNVSRPFIIKEIDAGRLPHRMVGTHRRIAFDDLVAYARDMRRRQEGALERMAENACALGLDY